MSRFADRSRVGHRAAEHRIGEEPIVGRGAERRLERQRIDRYDTSERARHVHAHPGVDEDVVGHGELTREHPGRTADVEVGVVRGDHERASLREIGGDRCRVIRMHAEARQEAAHGESGTRSDRAHRVATLGDPLSDP
jgi:hypothetical protein